MKVILLTDVKGRGKEGDVIEVARGYAANYLLPRKMAVMATPGNLKQLEARMSNIHKREETKRAEADGQAALIAGKKIVVEVKAGEAGKLFGSVTAGMVADALSEQLGVDVDRKKLDLHGHIKNVGEHTIDVRIYQEVTAQIVLCVVPVGEAPAALTVTEIVADADADSEVAADSEPEADEEVTEASVEEPADEAGLEQDEE